MGMAVDAPAHPQRAYLACRLHPLHLTMAPATVDTSLDMTLVVEMDEVRQFMNTRPWHRLFIIPERRQLDNFGAVLFHFFMAFHANLQRRHSCVSGFISVYMTMITCQI